MTLVNEPYFSSQSPEEDVCLNGSADVLLAIVPRRKDRIFGGNSCEPPPNFSAGPDIEVNGSHVADRLPNWRGPAARELELDSQIRIKNIERRLYLDFSTSVNGGFWAQKKMTVLCLYRRPSGAFRPAANAQIRITRWPEETGLKFDMGGGVFANELSLLADDQGMAELTIAHLTVSVLPNMRPVRIMAQATVPELLADGSPSGEDLKVGAETTVVLVRNDELGRVEEIFGKPDDPHSADRIWVFQPNEPSPRNEGIRRLQEALNEVVARHRGIQIAPNGLLELNGRFDANTRRFVRLYSEKFKEIHAGDEYPYELKDIGPDPDLITYIKEEYAPFDPTAEANRGCIVDRRLLIGRVLDKTPAKIDGLWELYEGVVKELQNGMRNYAQSYLDSDTFWLHRPIHGPYNPAQDRVFACHANGVPILSEATAASQPLQQAGGPVVLADGDHLLVVATAPGNWVQLRHPAGLGWVQVKPSTGRVFANAAGRYREPNNIGSQKVNRGNHGIAASSGSWSREHTVNGVAYTYGGKQIPEEWRATLLAIPHAPPDRIVHYDEYDAPHWFGETYDEYHSGDFAHMHAGCDCSGFIQNSINHAHFPGTQLRIVPSALCPLLPQVPISAGHFVNPAISNAPARKVMADPQSPPERSWIRGGDPISTDGHVVMVAEDEPDLNTKEFMIMHEFGGTASSDLSMFRRKSVRSPFSWWGIGVTAGRFGKVLIWR